MSAQANDGRAQGADPMNTRRQLVSAMGAITMSREYGSGGGEIATRLARRLGWQLVDHEVVVRVAQQLGVRQADVAAYDEQVEGLAARFLSNLSSLTSQWVEVGERGAVPPTGAAEAQQYHAALRQVVEAAVGTRQVVIVGRGAQVLLAARRDVLHVRVVAPLEQRIAYVASREGLDPAAARTRIRRKEQARARYLQTYYRQQPDDAHLYDLVINTGVLSLEDAVDLIGLALEGKAGRLVVPAEALGPAAGLARYADRPGDFGPPPRGTEPTGEN